MEELNVKSLLMNEYEKLKSKKQSLENELYVVSANINMLSELIKKLSSGGSDNIEQSKPVSSPKVDSTNIDGSKKRRSGISNKIIEAAQEFMSDGNVKFFEDIRVYVGEKLNDPEIPRSTVRETLLRSHTIEAAEERGYYKLCAN